MLKLENLIHSYADKSVLCDISLNLATGEIGCLLGPSGCGKTTALRLIAGFESLQHGVIKLDGGIVAQATLASAAQALSAKATPASATKTAESQIAINLAPELRQVGMVFQDYALFPHLTVAENIAFGLTKNDAAFRQQRVRDMLELINLEALAERYPHQLSGGQQQRIALARALAPRPRLILMDEPFSNLDVELREKLSLEVRDILKHEGITTLLVTHDQNEAFSIADKIAVMNDGVIQQFDSPYNLYHRPINRFVADFIGHGTLLPGVVKDAYSVQTELGLLKTEEPLSLDGGSCDADCRQCGISCIGRQVDLLIRPDDIQHDDNSEQTAEVMRKAFRGAEFIYTLKLPSGALLQVQVPSHHNHRIGEKIGIRPEVDHLVVFARGV